MFSRTISAIPSFARPIKPVLPSIPSTSFSLNFPSISPSFPSISPSFPSFSSTRLYSNDHSHGHGHGHVVPKVSAGVKVGTKEYLEKFHAHEINNPADKSWLPFVFNNKILLEIIAEISATEAYVQKLEPVTLIGKYKEQLGNFENVRRPALQKDGVAPRIIENLHEFYKFRANISEHELKDNIELLGFLPQDFRVTFDTGHVSKRKLVTGDVTERTPNTHPLLSSSSRFLKRASLNSSNEEQAANNIKLWRGFKGLANAIEKGLTDQQKDQILNVLRGEHLTPEDVAEIESAVTKLKESYQGGVGSRALSSILKQLRSDAHRQKFAEIIFTHPELKDELEEAKKQGDLVVHQSSAVAAAKSKFDSAISAALARAKTPEKAERIKKLAAAVDRFSSPTHRKDLELLDLFKTSLLTDEKVDKIFSVFQDNSDPENLVNDIINPHPIAAKMWFPRINFFSEDSVHYTQHFKEGNESLYQDITGETQKFDEIMAQKNFLSPELPPRYNTALEEIYEMKLERLAKQFLGYDLTTELGLAQFEYLVHKYDVSPGESYLDRVHTYPPPHHTYDELPIIKYDGYDPLSEEGLKAVAHHRSGHSSRH